MTRVETLTVLSLLRVSYPEAFRDMGKKDGDLMADVWATMFSKVPVQVVLLAVKRLIATSKWMPKVSEVREAVNEDLTAELRRMKERNAVTEEIEYKLYRDWVHSHLEIEQTEKRLIQAYKGSLFGSDETHRLTQLLINQTNEAMRNDGIKEGFNKIPRRCSRCQDTGRINGGKICPCVFENIVMAGIPSHGKVKELE